MTVRAIVLAAGKGTRMKSARPKVMHELCGRPMLWYVVQAVREAGVEDLALVVGPETAEWAASFGGRIVVQRERLGTAHAVGVALEALPARDDGRILIAYGDMPLVTAELFRGVIGALDDPQQPALALVTVKMPLPSSFGRVIRRGPRVERIVEARDATPAELEIDEMNAGIYAFEERALRAVLPELRRDNAQGEYYLTDAVAALAARGRAAVPVICGDHLHVLGINDRIELAAARKEMNARLCAHHMREGVTIVDPATTYLEPGVEIGADTVIFPNTAIGGTTRIGRECIVGPNTRLSSAVLHDRAAVRESVVIESEVGPGASVGPFAHLRGHAVLGEDVRIGNFVEVKNSRLARGVKASHLSYLGDATIGEETNVGAGTITCNFDGARKHPTTIGRRVSIGSNTSLIAPVTVGDEALTGAGAVVTKDVPAGGRVAGNPARPLPPRRTSD